jgi:hypothetical protein
MMPKPDQHLDGIVSMSDARAPCHSLFADLADWEFELLVTYIIGTLITAMVLLLSTG